MTRGDLETMVSYLLADPSNQRWTVANLTTLVNTAAQSLLPLCPDSLLWSLTKTSSGLTTGSSGEVTIPSDMARLLRITWDAIPTRRYHIAPLSNALVGGTAIEPTYVYQGGKLYFTPTTQSKAVIIHYIQSGVTMSATNTECSYPPDLHPAVGHLAAWMGYAGVGDGSTAQLHYQQAITQIRGLNGNNGTADY